MKKSALILLTIFIIISCTVFSGCQKNDTEPEVRIWENMPEKVNKNLKYFGFYHADYSDTSISEIAAMNCTNVEICIDSENIENSLKLCRKFGTKALIHSNFFIPDKMPADGERILREYDDVILGLHYDEPFLNKIPKEEFWEECKYIRAHYPDKILYAVMAFSDICNIPFVESAPDDYYKYCTVLAYDYYAAFDKDAVVSQTNNLKKRCTEGQKIWYCIKGFYADKGFNSVIENKKAPVGDELILSLKGHFELAANDEMIEGIVVFSYKDGSNSDWGISVENFVNENSPHYRLDVLQYYQQVGRTIIGK